MNSFEKEVIDRLGRIETKLDSDYRALHGNGQPGLIQNHQDLEHRVQSIEEQRKSERKHIGAAAGIAALIATIAQAIYNAFK